MAEIGYYTGAVLTRRDEKDRLALPAGLRNSIPGDPKTRAIYVSMHEDAPCLIGSGSDRVARLDAYIEKREEVAIRRGQPFNSNAARRKLFGGQTIPLDGSGRFTMPDNLWDLGDYSGELFFLGMGDYFEIWDLAALLALEGEDFEAAQAQARAAMRARDRAAAKKTEKP
jgi:MraZ protein